MSTELTRLIHDVATPLTMVKLNLEHLSENESKHSKTAQYIRRIQSGLDELDYLLAMDSPTDQQRTHRSTVIKEIQKILHIYDLVLRQSKINVEVDFLEDYFLVNSIDKFHRIIVNLLVNAVEALANCKHVKRICISTQRGNAGFVLRIKDNGMGIKKSDQYNIFNCKFTTKSHGKGIGLYNVKTLLLEYFNGFITCNSEEGKGAEFEIILPDPV